MMHLYITADTIGEETGGGKVTAHELAALSRLPGGFRVFRPRCDASDPFAQDADVLAQMTETPDLLGDTPGIAHVYAGCFSRTCEWLCRQGWKVTYTVAAHDVARSRAAHEELGWPFPYPHLTDPDLFERYTNGYVHLADVVICPSTYSQRVVREQGRTGRVEVIPHGVDIPEKIMPYTGGRFRVGYMGAVGADKGLTTLFRAWEIAYPQLPSGSVLVLAGKHTQGQGVFHLLRSMGCRAPVHCLGWVDRIADFYSQISLYCQPSLTEGYALEVPEAIAYGVPVLCSDGAGAADIVYPNCRFPAGDHAALAGMIVAARKSRMWYGEQAVRELAWDRIEAKYTVLWEELLR